MFHAQQTPVTAALAGAAMPILKSEAVRSRTHARSAD
jgi:hypothetical protein